MYLFYVKQHNMLHNGDGIFLDMSLVIFHGAKIYFWPSYMPVFAFKYILNSMSHGSHAAMAPSNTPRSSNILPQFGHFTFIDQYAYVWLFKFISRNTGYLVYVFAYCKNQHTHSRIGSPPLCLMARFITSNNWGFL